MPTPSTQFLSPSLPSLSSPLDSAYSAPKRPQPPTVPRNSSNRTSTTANSFCRKAVSSKENRGHTNPQRHLFTPAAQSTRPTSSLCHVIAVLHARRSLPHRPLTRT
ncbi:unnamed protein product, partial [Ectocarpus sp. 8 AP-2014]